MPDTPLLVSTEWLAARLDHPTIRIVDVRWYLLEKGRGYQEYLRGHIPAAIFMDIDRDLAAPPGSGPGRHPLPDAESFAETASRAGIGPDTHVIAYDDSGGATAGRLWWLLRYYGHERVSVLDAGITRWIAESRELQTEIPPVPEATFTPVRHPELMVTKQDVMAMQNDPSALILDSRSPERYTGSTEPVDSRAGHIPGAKNAPLAGNLRAADDQRFLDAEALRARFEALGANQAERIAVYCGSGVNACQNIIALQLAGYGNVQLFAGSFSDWSRDPELPVITGTEPT